MASQCYRLTITLDVNDGPGVKKKLRRIRKGDHAQLFVYDDRGRDDWFHADVVRKPKR